MTFWLVSIVGIVGLTLLVDIIVPEGQSNKYIKGVMAAVTMLVLIQPLPAVLNGSLDIGEYFDTEDAYIDERLADELTKIKSAQIESSVSALLDGKGIKNTIVDVVFENEFDYIVIINLRNVVIDKNLNHIFSSKLVSSYLEKELGIPGQRIKIYDS